MAEKKDRKETPDLMGKLLGGEAAKPVSQQARRTVGSFDDKPASQPEGDKPQEASKTKVTFHLSAQAVDALEDIWGQLRKEARHEQRGKVTKSAIVEAALLLALAGMEQEQGGSSKSEIAVKLSKLLDSNIF